MVSPRCRPPAPVVIACSRAVLARERLGEQVGEVEHLDVARAQRLGERVVLLLGPVHPRDPVEEELVVVAGVRRLSSGPAGAASRCEPADLAVGAVAAEVLGHGRTLVGAGPDGLRRAARTP